MVSVKCIFIVCVLGKLCVFENFKVMSKRVILFYAFEEEIVFGLVCWLWDYFRCLGVSGYFLLFFGGVDLVSMVVIVGSMC